MQNKSLGTAIAQRRKELGMTQLALAEKMGVTDKAVSKWERDLSCPDVSSFPRLAEVLGVSIEELMQSNPRPAPKGTALRETASLILRSVAVAMGAAVVVLAVMRALDVQSGFILLGIGLACLGLDSLGKGGRPGDRSENTGA